MAVSASVATAELKAKLEFALSRLNDQDTHRSGVDEIREFIQTLYPSWFPMVISCIQEAGYNLKPVGRCESVKLLSLLAEMHGHEVVPLLPRMMNVVLSYLKDADLHLREACADTVYHLCLSLVVEGAEGSSVFAAVLKPLFNALQEHQKGVQVGSAQCIAAVIQGSSTPVILENLSRLCARLVQYLNLPLFAAKPQMLTALVCLMQAVHGQDFDEVLPSVMPCLENCLAASADWQTRKQAIEVLQFIGDHPEFGASLGLQLLDVSVPTPLQRRLAPSLEVLKTDKVRAVREAAKDVLESWQLVKKSLASHVPPAPGVPAAGPASAAVPAANRAHSPVATAMRSAELPVAEPKRAPFRQARHAPASASTPFLGATEDRYCGEAAEVASTPQKRAPDESMVKVDSGGSRKFGDDDKDGPTEKGGLNADKAARAQAVKAALSGAVLNKTEKPRLKRDRVSLFKRPQNSNFFRQASAGGPLNGRRDDGLVVEVTGDDSEPADPSAEPPEEEHFLSEVEGVSSAQPPADDSQSPEEESPPHEADCSFEEEVPMPSGRDDGSSVQLSARGQTSMSDRGSIDESLLEASPLTASRSEHGGGLLPKASLVTPKGGPVAGQPVPLAQMAPPLRRRGGASGTALPTAAVMPKAHRVMGRPSQLGSGRVGGAPAAPAAAKRRPAGSPVGSGVLAGSRQSSPRAPSPEGGSFRAPLSREVHEDSGATDTSATGADAAAGAMAGLGLSDTDLTAGLGLADVELGPAEMVALQGAVGVSAEELDEVRLLMRQNFDEVNRSLRFVRDDTVRMEEFADTASQVDILRDEVLALRDVRSRAAEVEAMYQSRFRDLETMCQSMMEHVRSQSMSNHDVYQRLDGLEKTICEQAQMLVDQGRCIEEQAQRLAKQDRRLSEQEHLLLDQDRVIRQQEDQIQRQAGLLEDQAEQLQHQADLLQQAVQMHHQTLGSLSKQSSANHVQSAKVASPAPVLPPVPLQPPLPAQGSSAAGSPPVVPAAFAAATVPMSSPVTSMSSMPPATVTVATTGGASYSPGGVGAPPPLARPVASSPSLDAGRDARKLEDSRPTTGSSSAMASAVGRSATLPVAATTGAGTVVWPGASTVTQVQQAQRLSVPTVQLTHVNSTQSLNGGVRYVKASIQQRR